MLVTTTCLCIMLLCGSASLPAIQSPTPLLDEYPWPLSAITGVAWSPDSAQFAWATQDGRVFIYAINEDQLTMLLVAEVSPSIDFYHPVDLFWSDVLPQYLILDGRYRIDVLTSDAVEFNTLSSGAIDPIGFLPGSTQLVYSGFIKDGDSGERTYRTLDIQDGSIEFLSQPVWEDHDFENSIREAVINNDRQFLSNEEIDALNQVLPGLRDRALSFYEVSAPNGNHKLVVARGSYDFFLVDTKTGSITPAFDIFALPVVDMAAIHSRGETQVTTTADLDGDFVEDNVLLSGTILDNPELMVILGGEPARIGYMKRYYMSKWVHPETTLLLADDLFGDTRPEIIDYFSDYIGPDDGYVQHLLIYTTSETLEGPVFTEALHVQGSLRYELVDLQDDPQKEVVVSGDTVHGGDEEIVWTLLFPFETKTYYQWSGNALEAYKVQTAANWAALPLSLCSWSICIAPFLLIAIALFGSRKLRK